jgi:hypothetical protein
MSRFVLRYSGPGAASTDQAVESVARAGGRVLNVSGMMVLVECDNRAPACAAALPSQLGWRGASLASGRPSAPSAKDPPRFLAAYIASSAH